MNHSVPMFSVIADSCLSVAMVEQSTEGVGFYWELYQSVDVVGVINIQSRQRETLVVDLWKVNLV